MLDGTDGLTLDLREEAPGLLDACAKKAELPAIDSARHRRRATVSSERPDRSCTSADASQG
jgi:hypothetical protein